MEKYVIDQSFNLVKMQEFNLAFATASIHSSNLNLYLEKKISDIDFINSLIEHLDPIKKEKLYNILKYTNVEIKLSRFELSLYENILLILTFKSYADEILYFLGS
jgi:hypothetical protein